MEQSQCIGALAYAKQVVDQNTSVGRPPKFDFSNFVVFHKEHQKFYYVYRPYGAAIKDCPTFCPRCPTNEKNKIADSEDGSTTLRGNDKQRYDPWEALYNFRIPVCITCYNQLHRTNICFLDSVGLLQRIRALLKDNGYVSPETVGFVVKSDKRPTPVRPTPVPAIIVEPHAVNMDTDEYKFWSIDFARWLTTFDGRLDPFAWIKSNQGAQILWENYITVRTREIMNPMPLYMPLNPAAILPNDASLFGTSSGFTEETVESGKISDADRFLNDVTGKTDISPDDIFNTTQITMLKQYTEDTVTRPSVEDKPPVAAEPPASFPADRHSIDETLVTSLAKSPVIEAPVEVKSQTPSEAPVEIKSQTPVEAPVDKPTETVQKTTQTDEPKTTAEQCPPKKRTILRIKTRDTKEQEPLKKRKLEINNQEFDDLLNSKRTTLDYSDLVHS